MKKIFLLCLVLSLSAFVNVGLAVPNIWTGPTTTFTKADYADWTLPENQDRITDNVWLTRGDLYPLFNAKTQIPTWLSEGPTDTEWAFSDMEYNPVFDFGAAADYDDLTFKGLNRALGLDSIGDNIVDRPGVLHLITDDIYIDIEFSSWTSGQGGGGISYERSTIPEPTTIALLGLGGLALLRKRWS